MAAKLEKTNTPGIFRRHAKGCAREGRCDCSYVIVRPTMRTFGTFAEAREGKSAAERGARLARGHAAGLHRDEPRRGCPDCDRDRGERELTDPLLHEYALSWIERYAGTGSRGFREETRDEHRRLLGKFALRFFAPEARLSELNPRVIAEFIAWLTKQKSSRGGTLSDRSVRNALVPLSACLATARREGLIEHNPSDAAALPHRPRVEEDEDAPRPFPRIEDSDGQLIETMELVVALVHPNHRLLFELLASTGVRRSELIAFEVRHLALDGERPFVRVRQRARRQKGKGIVIGALKSRHAKRDLPIPPEVADRLAAHVRGRSGPELVFATQVGTVLDPDNLADRVLAPACEEAGVEWAGFHTFRHTVASRMFAAGRNVVQVQRWLGHHSPSFTLDTYVHLLDDDLGEPLRPATERLPRVNAGSTARPKMAANEISSELVESAH